MGEKRTEKGANEGRPMRQGRWTTPNSGCEKMRWSDEILDDCCGQSASDEHLAEMVSLQPNISTVC